MGSKSNILFGCLRVWRWGTARVLIEGNLHDEDWYYWRREHRRGLTRRFRAVGHEVAVANAHGPASLADLARETGARAVSLDEVVRGNDIVVVAIPEKRVEDLPPGLFSDALDHLIVIDTGNYYPQERDGRIDGIEAGLTESAWVQQRLGHPVVKTFNTIFAQHLLENGKPAGAAGRIALAVAADDAADKKTVMALIDGIGFDAVDGGTIAESWRQQPGSPGYGKDYEITQAGQALAQASEERAPQWRATPNSPGTYTSPA